MTPELIELKSYLEKLHTEIQRETQRHSGSISSLTSAERFAELRDNFYSTLTTFYEQALNSGRIAELNIPDEFDSTIPTLKLIPKVKNILDVQAVISTARYDGTSVCDALESLHVSTYRGTYKGDEVEIREYFGGSEDYLIQTVRGLVEHYQAFDSPHIQQLFGGAVTRGPSGQLPLRAYLVFSPLEGEPWLDVVKEQRSVELLCHIAEETAKVFQHLKLHRQINWECIRVRPDGSLLVVPTTEGEVFLHDEDVLNPFRFRENFDWPLSELCLLLHESSKQGILIHAIDEIRDHKDPWTKIAVWEIARMIGLRPPEDSMTFGSYPPREWTTDPGRIIRWHDISPAQWHDRHFQIVGELPREAMTQWEREHLTTFVVINAWAQRGNETINYSEQFEGTERCLPPTEDGEWEYMPLEPWEGVKLVDLYFESARLDLMSWRTLKEALVDESQENSLNLDELGIIVRTNASFTIRKCDVPELGTRPLYFYRKPNRVTASPREFWGFYSFNKDPLGPTGLTVRYSGPNNWGRIVSESLPPDPVDYIQTWYEINFEVFTVNMHDDWAALVKNERAKKRYNQGEPFTDSDIELPDADDRMDED